MQMHAESAQMYVQTANMKCIPCCACFHTKLSSQNVEFIFSRQLLAKLKLSRSPLIEVNKISPSDHVTKNLHQKSNEVK